MKILEQESQKKVVIGAMGTSLEEPSLGSDTANIDNNDEQEGNKSFQSESVEKYIHHGHDHGQLPEDLVRYEYSVSTMVHMILSFPYHLMMYKVMRALRLG